MQVTYRSQDLNLLRQVAQVLADTHNTTIQVVETDVQSLEPSYFIVDGVTYHDIMAARRQCR